MVRWLEVYARESHDSLAPNSMWQRRPWGQLEKCAEAAALRAALPEEIGGDYAAEEVSAFDAESVVATPSPAPSVDPQTLPANERELLRRIEALGVNPAAAAQRAQQLFGKRRLESLTRGEAESLLHALETQQRQDEEAAAEAKPAQRAKATADEPDFVFDEPEPMP